MKIIHINHNDSNGGAAIAAYRIHSCLVQNGVDSEMWVEKKFSKDKTVFEKFSLFDKIRKKFILITARLIKLVCGEMSNATKTIGLLSSPWLKKINNSDADIVHIHWSGKETISIKQLQKIDKCIVWSAHDFWIVCGTEHIPESEAWQNGYDSMKYREHYKLFNLNKFVWRMKKRYWKNHIKIISPSNWLKNEYLKSPLIDNLNIDVIPHPIDHQEWYPEDKEASREYLDIAEEDYVILFGADGGIKSENKGFDLFSNAVKNLVSQNIDKKYTVLIFGENKAIEFEEKRMNVINLGHINEISTFRKVYSAADVYVSSSRIETFGLTVQESITCGTPVVAYSNNGTSEILRDYKNGFSYKELNNKSLEEAIESALKNLKKSQDLSSTLFSYSQENYSYKIISDMLVRNYSRIILNENE